MSCTSSPIKSRAEKILQYWLIVFRFGCTHVCSLILFTDSLTELPPEISDTNPIACLQHLSLYMWACGVHQCCELVTSAIISCLIMIYGINALNSGCSSPAVRWRGLERPTWNFGDEANKTPCRMFLRTSGSTSHCHRPFVVFGIGRIRISAMN